MVSLNDNIQGVLKQIHENDKPKLSRVLTLSGLYPFLSVSFYVASLLVMLFRMDSFGVLDTSSFRSIYRAFPVEITSVGVAVVFSFFISVMQAGNVLLYLSIPSKLYGEISELFEFRKVVKRCFSSLTVAHFFLALLSLFYPVVLCGAAFYVIIVFLFMNAVISYELFRVGLNTFLEKISN